MDSLPTPTEEQAACVVNIRPVANVEYDPPRVTCQFSIGLIVLMVLAVLNQ